MRFLVLGVSGMAGHVISIYLKEQGHDVIGFSRRQVNFVQSITGDVFNKTIVREVIEKGKFDAVINAVGILNQFAESNKEAAVYLNGYLPHYLAKLTSNMNTQIIHMSTDCVFSGKHGPYTETALRDGEIFYDRSKAIGELEDDKNLTLRNSIIGPDINEKGIGLLNWFMTQSGEINGYTSVLWTGLTTLQLAKVIEAAVAIKANGLVNMVYEENISKYQLLNLFNKYLKNGNAKIKAFDGITVNKTLIRTNFNFDYTVPNYEIMIAQMADWMMCHKELYPHYYL